MQLYERVHVRKPRRPDLRGKQFGRWIVLRFAGYDRHSRSVWLCRCDCGGEKQVAAHQLLCGASQSCGCYHKERIETAGGVSRHPLFTIWKSMHARCYQPKATSYSRYGARGITVCERWHTFENFASDMGPRSAGASIERRDSTGPYEPGNCCWSTSTAQARNRRSSLLITFLGETKALAEWCEILGLEYHATWHRLRRRGVSVEALFTRLD